MPLKKTASKGAFKSNLRAEINAGKPKDQALAIAYRVQREAKAAGGPVLPYTAVQTKAPDHSGMINSPVPGRTDRLPMNVKSGSYVIPADVVSGIGQGNSLAGARGLSRMFGAPRVSRMPMKGMKQKFADGGEVADIPVEIVAAGGEYVIDPEQIAEIGGGDISRGHEILDAFVKQVRSKTIKTLKTLPGPKKN